MTTKQKKYSITFVFAMLLIHFSIICSNLIKPNVYSNFYTNPFFEQNWNLFVPPPNSNYNLFVINENNVTEDVFNEIVEQHQRNRLSGYEPLVIAISTAIHYFEKEALEQNFNGGEVKNNQKFMILQRVVKNYLQDKKHANLKEVKIILSEKSINNKSPRIYYN